MSDTTKTGDTGKHLPSPKFYALVGIAAITGLIALGWYMHHTHARLDVLADCRHRVNRLDTTIARLDEAIRASARMAAVTGDPGWQQRYLASKSELEDATKEAYALAPRGFMRDAMDQARMANRRLTAMEHLAFEVMHEGRLQAATDLLNSSEYERQSQMYRNGTERFIAGLEQHTLGEMDRHRRMLFGASTLCVFFALLTTVSGFAALRLHTQGAARKDRSACLLQLRAAFEQQQFTSTLEQTCQELEHATGELKQIQLQIAEQEKLASTGQLIADHQDNR